MELKELSNEDILKGLKRATKSEYLKGIKINDETFSLRFITSHKTINNNSKYYETGIIIFLSFICFVFIIKKIKNKNEL